MKDIIQSLCLAMIGLLLLGYLIGDKGFAHIGMPPLYISEMVLTASIIFFIFAPELSIFYQSKLILMILAIDSWCFLQTVPYIETYGLDSLRDSAIYGYSIFAIIIANYMLNPKRIEQLCLLYWNIIIVCIIMMPIILIFQVDESELSEDNLPLLLLKPGDVAIQLVGILSFELLGLRAATLSVFDRGATVLRWVFWGAWIMVMLWVVSMSRGGLLALVCGLSVVALFRFRRAYVMGFITAIVAVMVLLSVLDIRYQGERRDISSTQVVDNILSLFKAGGLSDANLSGDMEGTAEWRLLWWHDIVDYSVFGPYFWTGKGFGINLASDDGYQTDVDERLRSPHNGHLTFLARSGVPGLMLWLSFLVCFAVALFRMAARLRKRGLFGWQRLNLWILSYWIASVVNASFDVYLEGPQGGIWFWSITGLGVAALALEHRALSGQLSPAEAQVFQRMAMA
jgi:hypothetical protein